LTSKEHTPDDHVPLALEGLAVCLDSLDFDEAAAGDAEPIGAPPLTEVEVLLEQMCENAMADKPKPKPRTTKRFPLVPLITPVQYGGGTSSASGSAAPPPPLPKPNPKMSPSPHSPHACTTLAQ
jgi:hypothetical protein